MSDLHLEVGEAYGTFDIPVRAPYLLLAGDIGRLQDYDQYCLFLQRQCVKYERVFLILGDYEFYGVSRGEGLQLAHQLCSEPILNQKLVLLNRGRYDINDRITILGCTLQPRISSQEVRRVQQQDAQTRRRAMRKIQEQNSEHEGDVEWLKHELQRIRNEGDMRMIVIATHHAPSFKPPTNVDSSKSIWNADFCSNLLLGEATTWNGIDQVGFWVFGHTHWNVHKQINPLLDLVSNQRGHVQPGTKKRSMVTSRSPNISTGELPTTRKDHWWSKWRKGDNSFSLKSRRPKSHSSTSSSSSSLASSTKAMDFPFNPIKIIDLSDKVRRLEKFTDRNRPVSQES